MSTLVLVIRVRKVLLASPLEFIYKNMRLISSLRWSRSS